MKPRIEAMENVTKSREESVAMECRYRGDGEITVEWIAQGTILGAPDPQEDTQVCSSSLILPRDSNPISFCPVVIFLKL